MFSLSLAPPGTGTGRAPKRSGASLHRRHRPAHAAPYARGLGLSLSPLLSLARALSLTVSHLHRPVIGPSSAVAHLARRGRGAATSPSHRPIGASLDESGAARVAVTISGARQGLLVAARLERMQTRIAELDVDPLVIGAPLTLRVSLALAALSRCEERAIGAEDDVAPIVPVPPRVLQPLEVLAHAVSCCASLRPALTLDEALPLDFCSIRPDRGDRAVLIALLRGAECDKAEQAA
mmetsp:Transcript_17520/g.35616  ORF Transcript_17520/g.35616 Transcript_17520/m.35616 type:complete len:237 (+) Transcript_17520:118-828(+)|eukprot:CAMPEP_0119073486 /NCGR_PEP_ID=MMETSP1178-20130426/65978_1 /TAXON_ID=33656 /ORGANISM="unid sp, Strain CCMP2000" /LENGTH=236 /DNA_ID=CAMNT_0007055567 /DNA_START=109 /DNA_END=819 /DNA_ORIENTATION=+